MKYILQKQIEEVLKNIGFEINTAASVSNSFRTVTTATIKPAKKSKQVIEIIINCAKEECFLTYYRRILTDIDVFRLILSEKDTERQLKIEEFLKALKKLKKEEQIINNSIKRINKTMEAYND